MNDLSKKILRSALTLGIIAGTAALLIGLTNMVTAPIIEANANAAENEGLTQVFDGDYTTEEIEDLDTSSYSYIEKIWIAYESGSNSQLGYIYKTTGSNTYGSVSILLGISGEGDLGTMYVLENSESYATTLQSNYIDVYNASDDKNNAIYDVSCGATVGATLIKNMANEALNDYQSRLGVETGDDRDVIFDPGTGRNTYEEIDISSESYTYITEISICYTDGEEVGYVYRTKGTTQVYADEWIDIDMYVGISGSGDLGTIYLISDGSTAGNLTNFINHYNESEDKDTALTETSYSSGATYSAKLVAKMASEALDDYMSRFDDPRDNVFPSADGSKNSYTDVEFDSSSYTYIQEISICYNNDVEQGYVYRTTGTTQVYADTWIEIDMYVGISGTGDLGNIYIISDGSNSPSGDIDDYLDNYNSADDKDAALDDTSLASGATYSARLVSNMVSEALDDYVGRIA